VLRDYAEELLEFFEFFLGSVSVLYFFPFINGFCGRLLGMETSVEEYGFSCLCLFRVGVCFGLVLWVVA
jgi:hypothetical protein